MATEFRVSILLLLFIPRLLDFKSLLSMTDQPDNAPANAPTDAPLHYENLNHLIIPKGALNSAAELHGMLCGKLCGGAHPESADWQHEALEFLDLAEGADGEILAALEQLRVESLTQLQSSEFGFVLMLPGDDAELDLRATALGEWCHGFLSGFGSAGVKPETEIPADAAEALRDMAAIVQIEVDGSSEEEEAGFFDVAEYVRMAALTLFLEFNPLAASLPVEDASTLH